MLLGGRHFLGLHKEQRMYSYDIEEKAIDCDAQLRRGHTCWLCNISLSSRTVRCMLNFIF